MVDMPGTSSKDRLDITSGDIQVVARTAQLLRLLTTHETIDLVTAAAELGVGKSTAHRYLASMENHGLLHRRDRNRYECGELLAELGTVALSRLGVIEVARPVMEAVSVEVQQTVVLSIWNGQAPVVMHVHEDSSRTAHVSIKVGSVLRQGTAQFLVFYAFRDHTFHRFRGEPFAPAISEADLAVVRETRVAVRYWPDDGIRALAVPVFDANNLVVATLGVVGIAQFVPEEIDSPVARALLRGADTIKNSLSSSLEGDGEDQP
ncbi:IclR family transcriptional regulator [Actinomadura madurae]|uniref:IclR family transcriptional regulator n=1 Tax=Actinomadura madurae TaxID=1993 RepID=UPI0020270317|nr:helix-turn-helix domain-containing protein [Actinomadura madurae]MCP9952630.1 helix-turn-helix domain-containing protein [Actinomadura madurae]MCP9969392.1 helix-turn-helix domain-containing protein [Actinomadura madurae]MCP9981856.1 helix-turn-helix domain-containing protein [Actinomadura madurae]MCQ0006619.1 helix-turn-helix domain-containing protein [Actinomadura madurae]MCQ0018081.1 helix-turn-helix domain-containing protein [Actinomadura madurae]